MQVKISTTNSKLSGQIPSVNLPPITTCRHNAPCSKTCYACKGNFTYPKVKSSLANNYAYYIKDSKAYFNDIIQQVNSPLTIYKFFRWHSSGDIVDYNYLCGMVKVAQKCKNTKFLAFTKKFEIVNEYLNVNEKLPNNLKIVFSAWDKDFKVENPHNLPVAYINLKDETKTPTFRLYQFHVLANVMSVYLVGV